jgi:hypothetical protein
MSLLIKEDRRDAGPTGMKSITQNNRYCLMQTTSMGCEPLKLLSWKLTIKHPLHGNPVTFSAPTPIWIGSTR